MVNGSIYIHNLLFVKDSNPLPSPESGYTRLDVDLNKGAGGKYIYLEFTRDPNSVKQEHPDYNLRNEPITDFKAIAYNTGLSEWTAPPKNYSYIYEHTPYWALTSYKIIDLNDGAGGKYIYGYQSRNFVVYGNSIKEVGILYGNSSSIQPPSGWIKQPQDLNEGAGGDYIYFCYKK
ncbi:hypothetical protein [Pontibacter cellulosilyticus]|uniref:MABP domain-containing protein n=1 Tax=Pontibacter cellulosilyticus TaxID=1720253 RepID=A0A923SJV5_9BACT|nr:hypothetical protein [Pontibacter cellulosilyticus]MBC5994223.1 hypothetical protein [Pontibacter cellulosilyticus]